MMKRSGLVVAALVVLFAGDASAASRSGDERSARSQPLLVGPGLTLAVDLVDEPGPTREPGIVALSVTLTNHSGAALNVSYRNFALSGDDGARYPALLPSELAPGHRSPVPLREGVLGNGETLTALLHFRAPALRLQLVELRVDLADVHDNPIARTFLPIVALAPRG